MDERDGFRATIEAGGVVLGARTATLSPTVIEAYGGLGLDFVWVDLEHTGPSPQDAPALEGLTRAADVAGIDLLVRVPTGDPAEIRKVLDAGVRNVLVPRIESAAEVRQAVRATRFVYEGEPGDRGLASSRANAWGAAEGYAEAADATVCLGVMIETAEAADAIHDVLSVPGLGFVFVGPSDLSVQLGHPGEKTHPDVVDRIAAIREACLDAGVPLGALAHDPERAVAAIEEGCQVVRIGGDLEAVRATIGDRLAAIRERT